MRQGIAPIDEPVDRPQILTCGAYVSQRTLTARCQACYGRQECRCGAGTSAPCVNGTHVTPAARRSRQNAGRINEGFVDVNRGRPGMGS